MLCDPGKRDADGRAPAWPETRTCGPLADKLSLLEFRLPQTRAERWLPRNPVAFTAPAPSEPVPGTQASAPRPSLRPERLQQRPQIPSVCLQCPLTISGPCRPPTSSLCWALCQGKPTELGASAWRLIFLEAIYSQRGAYLGRQTTQLPCP